jgi:hypothetical protein
MIAGVNAKGYSFTDKYRFSYQRNIVEYSILANTTQIVFLI